MQKLLEDVGRCGGEQSGAGAGADGTPEADELHATVQRLRVANRSLQIENALAVQQLSAVMGVGVAAGGKGDSAGGDSGQGAGAGAEVDA